MSGLDKLGAKVIDQIAKVSPSQTGERVAMFDDGFGRGKQRWVGNELILGT